jgi:hypothetical protein
MSLSRLVVTAVRIEGRTKAEVARDYGVSPRWVYELCRRFDVEGDAGLERRSGRPRRSPQRTARGSRRYSAVRRRRPLVIGAYRGDPFQAPSVGPVGDQRRAISDTVLPSKSET